jgi:hypothetical protein
VYVEAKETMLNDELQTLERSAPPAFGIGPKKILNSSKRNPSTSKSTSIWNPVQNSNPSLISIGMTESVSCDARSKCERESAREEEERGHCTLSVAFGRAAEDRAKHRECGHTPPRVPSADIILNPGGRAAS